MAHKKASVIVLIVLISFTCAQLDVKLSSTEIPATSSSTSDSSSTSTEFPDSSSVKPTTSEPTSTTEVPNTTSLSPDTTTTASTTTTTTVAPTTASTTSSTTVSPTTTVAPSPTPSPTPVPQPEYKKWAWQENNQTCVIVQLAVQLNLTYQNTADKAINALYNVPVNKTKVETGSCGNDSQSITVQWGQLSKMMLQFTANTTAQQFMLSEIHLSINASDVFADAKADQTIELFHIRDEFATTFAMSYHCNKIQTIGFTNAKDSKDVVANATIAHVQFEAFHKQNTDQFSTARDCEAIDTPDIVPIAVGCALAGLVVVVLIAYLVGRRRAQASGYLSM